MQPSLERTLSSKIYLPKQSLNIFKQPRHSIQCTVLLIVILALKVKANEYVENPNETPEVKAIHFSSAVSEHIL